MPADRNEILKNFLENEELYTLTGLSKEALNDISFEADDDGHVLVEALKKMIISFERKESNPTIIKNINLVIQKHSEKQS